MKTLWIVADAVAHGTGNGISLLEVLVCVLLGAVSAYIGYHVTHNHMQRKLDDLKSRLEKEHEQKMSELKQTMMSGVAQELQSPITLIIAPLQQMVTEPMGEDLRLRIHMVLRNVQMLLHQVNMLSVGMRSGIMSQVDMQVPTSSKAEVLAHATAFGGGVSVAQGDGKSGMDDAAMSSELIDDHNAADATEMPEDADDEMAPNHRFTMLIVDDSIDMCRFVRDYFRGEYNVITAHNGEEAVKCLNEIDDIDLVVSDVSMPKMDGLELCKYVKSDLRWSHIPVILLTGQTDEEMEVEGLKLGADDYITKPFNAEMLRLRVKKLIETKENRQKQFKEDMNVSASDLTITSVDEHFIQRALKICQDHISDTDFSVEVLGQELSMSRTYLYKKLMNITGKGPSEFIRLLRLKQGKQYLDQMNMPITEVAAAVGYASSKRFSENFKVEFGMSPSEYVRKLRAEQQTAKK